MVLDLEGRITGASEDFLRLLGRTRDQVEGRSFTEVVHPDDVALAFETGRAAVLGDEPTHVEQRYVRGDGQQLWVLVTVRAVRDEQGRAYELCAEVRDVTAERVAEAARARRDDYRSAAPLLDDEGRFQGSLGLVTDTAQRREAEEQRQRLAAIVESTSDAVFGLDEKARIRDANAAAVALTGVRREEILGVALSEVLEPLSSLPPREILRRVLAGEDVPPLDSPVRRPDGRAVEVSASFGPIRDGSGAIVGVSVVARDVTAERDAARRLERLARQQQAVAALGHQALEGTAVEALHHEAVAAVRAVLDAPIVTILEPVEGGDALRLSAAEGVERDLLGLEIDPDVAPRLDALGTDAVLVYPDWEDELRFTRPPIAVELGIRSSVAVIVAGRRAHAFLSAHRHHPWTPDADEIAFLQAVANVLAAARDRADTEEAVRRQALHDPVTGLPNRTLVGDRLVQALERARRRGTTTALCVIDLDKFKAINDTLGHAAGDEVLVTMAGRLTGLVRPVDTVGRFGGDAFVVLCEDVGETDEAAHLAPRLIAALAEPIEIGSEEHVITASAGIAFDTGGTLSAEEMLRNADAAMYRAKERGRGRIEVFGQELLDRTLGRVHMERDLRGALDRGELWLAFQPIVSLVDDRVVGLEALLRWRHPERGDVSPADFIPIAEESGLIGDIGTWVVRQACAHAARWNTAVQVNVSPRQLDDDHLPAVVARALSDTGLPPARLTLEITEGTVMDQGSDPVEVLRALRHLGVHVVLDDFGTGYSSLSRLRGLPIDGLKIDRSFVSDLSEEGSPGELLVGGVIRVCAALGVSVVAEGVETEGQRSHLARLGCLLAQGFLLARPMPPEAVARHLSRR